MPTATIVATRNAINYVENEIIRGLMVIISDVGLSLNSLLDNKESLVTGILFHLERRTLRRVQVEFYDKNGNSLNNGFGKWKFIANYGSYGRGIVELPVGKVLEEIRRNRWVLLSASSYKITLWVDSGAELPPGWSWGKDDKKGSTQSTFVGSFGWDPISMSIYRE